MLTRRYPRKRELKAVYLDSINAIRARRPVVDVSVHFPVTPWPGRRSWPRAHSTFVKRVPGEINLPETMTSENVRQCESDGAPSVRRASPRPGRTMPARQCDRRAEGFARAVPPRLANSRRFWRGRDGRGDLARGLGPRAHGVRLDRGDCGRMELGIANEPDDRLRESADVVRIAKEAERAALPPAWMWFRGDAGFSEPQALADRQTPAFGEARKDEGRAAVRPDELILRWRIRSTGRGLLGRRVQRPRSASPRQPALPVTTSVRSTLRVINPLSFRNCGRKNLDQRRIGPLLFHLSRAY